MSIQTPTFKRLVVDELRDTALAESVTFAKPIVIERLMMHLYIEGAPAGTVTLRIRQGGTVASEASLDLTEAASQAGKTMARYHGYVSFKFPKPPILKAGTYTVELEAATYSFGSAWIGWVKLPTADRKSVV